MAGGGRGQGCRKQILGKEVKLRHASLLLSDLSPDMKRERRQRLG